MILSPAARLVVRGVAIVAWLVLAGGLAAMTDAPRVLVVLVVLGAAVVAAPAVLLLAEAVGERRRAGK